MLFLMLMFYSTLVGFSISHLVYMAQYDSLLVLTISGIVGCILSYIYVKFANRRPGEFFVHYGSEIFPKWIHLSFMGLFFFFFLHTSAYILREYEDFIVQTYLSQTPNWAVGVLIGFVVAYTARLGIQTLFRTAQGLFFMVLFAYFLDSVFIWKELTWDRGVAFITNHSFKGIYNGIYTSIPFFGEIFLIIFVFPYFTQKNKTFKTMCWSIFWGLLIINSNIFFLLLLFGPNLTSHITYPMLELVRYIRIADFIENLDPFLIAIWSTTVYLKLSIVFYIANLIAAQVFGLKDHRPLTFSLAAVMVALSLQMSGGTAALTSFYNRSWATYAYFIELIPILYLLMDSVKKMIRKKSAAKQENM